MVDKRVPFYRGQNAGGESENKRHGEREETELDRSGQFIGDDLVDGAVGVFGRAAKVAVKQDAVEVVEILAMQRQVQAVVGFEVTFDFRRSGLFAVKRSTGHEPDHEKRGRYDDEENRDRLQKTTGDETKHGKR